MTTSPVEFDWDSADWTGDDWTGWDDEAKDELNDYTGDIEIPADDGTTEGINDQINTLPDYSEIADDGTTGGINDEIAKGGYGGFSTAELKNLFKGSPMLSGLLSSMGAAAVGKLIDKVMGVKGGPAGYSGGIPTLTASRQQLPIPTTMQDASGKTVARRPGAGGITYFSPMQYLKPGETPADSPTTAIGQTGSVTPGGGTTTGGGVDASGIAAALAAKQAGVNYGSGAEQDKYTSPPPTQKPDDVSAAVMPSRYFSAVPYMPYMPTVRMDSDLVEYAKGGITSLGGYSDGGRLLRGPGDGVSDSIPAKIGKRQPARLADGEFVVPARIVSELGNGSTEAGARKLYAMMDRIKKARRKATNIAADTKADKHLPA